MSRSAEAAVDFVEAAYNLELPPRPWLGHVLESGLGLIDGMERACATIWSGLSEGGSEPLVTEVYASPEFPELPMRYANAAAEVPPEEFAHGRRVIWGRVSVLSEARQNFPYSYELFTRHLECKDGLGLFACDPDGRGINVVIPCQEIVKLTPAERERWNRLAVHLAAGHRVRVGIRAGDSRNEPVRITQLPHFAEAIVDATKFEIAQAEFGAKAKTASETIRAAAKAVDRARGKLRKNDPDEALGIWQGLVRGRWSLVDWFDSDGRRFMLAKPNAPHLGDPRGLTERELQVVTYAARGESEKMIGYRFGLSKSYVSGLLRSAMHKLGAKTQAQLVEKLRVAPEPPPSI